MPRKPKTTTPGNARPELPAAVARVLAGTKTNADSGALLNDLIEVWGGTKRLALDVYAEYQKAPAGGMTRQRILEMLQRLVITNTTHEITKVRNPSDMSDEELEHVALSYLKRMTTDEPPPPARAREEEGGEG